MPRSIPARQDRLVKSVEPELRRRWARKTATVLQAALAAALFTIGLTPSAVAQEAQPAQQQTFEESILDMGTPAEFFAANPDELLQVFEHARPDLDADGVGDLVFPAHANAEEPLGSVSVMSRWTMDDLYTVSSVEENDGFGMLVSSAANMFGDGGTSLIVSAPLSNAGAPFGGRVYVYDGKTGDLQWTITGTTERGAFGFAVAPIGDANGDGLEDLLIGAPADGAGTTGRAYLFHGRPLADGPIHLTAADADKVLEDGKDGSSFGFSVAGAGDVTGDGRPELLIGAPTDGADAAPNTGAALIFSGATGERLATIVGAAQGAGLGTSLLGVVDISGDGLADVLVGAPDAPRFEDVDLGRVVSDGRVLIYFSQTLGALAPGAVLNEANADAALQPIDGAEAMFGSSIQHGNDMDGDGVADILVGSTFFVENLDPLATEGEPEERKFLIHDLTHVHSGATGLLLYSFETNQGSGRPVLVPFVPPPGAEPEPQALLGDVDQNGLVQILDLALVMTSYGVIDPTIADTDINADGVTDSTDVFIVLDQLDPDAVAYALATDGDCLDLNGIPLDPCDCLELLGDLDLNDTTDGCNDDDGGGDPEPGPGPGPGPGDNCDEMPRTTVAECEAWAACQAGAMWDNLINGDLQSAADANAAADALEAEAAEARVAADAADNVVKTVTQPQVRAERTRALKLIDACETTALANAANGYTCRVQTAFLVGALGGAATGAIRGFFVGGVVGAVVGGVAVGVSAGVTTAMVTAAVQANATTATATGIRASMKAQRTQLDALFITGSGSAPACLTLTNQLKVIEAAQAHDAAWDAWEAAEAVVAEKHDAAMTKRQEAEGFKALAAAAQQLKEEDRQRLEQECVMELTP